MNNFIFVVGFLLPLPAYFNDSVAEYLQNLGGSIWSLFSSLGFIFYPFYLAIFIVPIFLVISWIMTKLNPDRVFKRIFLKLFYGFLISSSLFIILAITAISQFQFGF